MSDRIAEYLETIDPMIDKLLESQSDILFALRSMEATRMETTFIMAGFAHSMLCWQEHMEKAEGDVEGL